MKPSVKNEVTHTAPRKDKPTPIRITDIKANLQMWAMEEDRSMNYIIVKILREAVQKKFGYIGSKPQLRR